MTNTPERYDHHEDGMEIAEDGDFVSYEDYAAEFARAGQAEARVKELEGVLGVLRALSYTHSRGVRSEEFVSLFKGASHTLGIKAARVRKGVNAKAVVRAALSIPTDATAALEERERQMWNNALEAAAAKILEIHDCSTGDKMAAAIRAMKKGGE
jgi:hypothetical protein